MMFVIVRAAGLGTRMAPASKSKKAPSKRFKETWCTMRVAGLSHPKSGLTRWPRVHHGVLEIPRAGVREKRLRMSPGLRCGEIDANRSLQHSLDIAHRRGRPVFAFHKYRYFIRRGCLAAVITRRFIPKCRSCSAHEKRAAGRLRAGRSVEGYRPAAIAIACGCSCAARPTYSLYDW